MIGERIIINQKLLNTLYILTEGKAGSKMADLVVENLILSAELDNLTDLKKIHNALPDTSYNPEKLPAVIFHYHNPSRVVFITTQGKMVCTGAKTKEDAALALTKTIDALKTEQLIDESNKVTPRIESLVISKNLNVSLPLSTIQTKLPYDQCTYQPSIHPWLEYHESTYSMLLFSTGNIICTGKISLEESKAAFKKIEDILASIGCKVAE
jgi:transcription initiation factor TFIID TATA-box-binding protein